MLLFNWIFQYYGYGTAINKGEGKKKIDFSGFYVDRYRTYIHSKIYLFGKFGSTKSEEYQNEFQRTSRNQPNGYSSIFEHL
jgi:hypothetical protein